MAIIRRDPGYVDPDMLAGLYQDPMTRLQGQYQTTTETPEQTIARGTTAQQMVDVGVAGPGAEPGGMSSAQAAQILSGINPKTGQYDPSIANNSNLIAQARIAFGYDTPTGAAGPRSVGGTPTATADAWSGGGPSPAELLGAPSARDQFTPGYRTGLTGTGEAPMGGQPLNERGYADEPTTAWLAEQLGGEATMLQGAAYPGGGNPNMSGIRLPDGRIINAGQLATYIGSQQIPYQQAAEDYQRNRGGNVPMTPLARLQQSLEQDKVRWGTSGYEVGQPFPQQPLPRGYQRPPQFQPGAGINAPGASGPVSPAGGQQPGGGQQLGGQGQPINMGGFGGFGFGNFGQQSPAGFGGGLNFAMAPNSLYYPNMRSSGYAGFGGFPYTGGGMNFGGAEGGGDFPGGFSQFQNPLMGFGNMGGFANFNNATQNYMGQFQNRPQMGAQNPWSSGRNMYNRAPSF